MNIYEEISKYEKRQRDEIAKEKKKRKRQVCIDPNSIIGKEITYQTALLHENLNEARGGKTSSEKINDFQKQKVWASFPERHPWIPVIISIVALIVAYTRG